MENMRLYAKLAEVPAEAQKTIGAGRLKGFTDINPMWRIKALTEAFGPCGFGWKYEITDKRLETGAKGEICAFVDIALQVCENGVWSEKIPGTGGASFVAEERNGLHTSDECFKMALTDAISVAGKALGLAAAVYYQKDRSKYNSCEPVKTPESYECIDCGSAFKGFTWDGKEYTAKDAYEMAKKKAGGAPLCKTCRQRTSEEGA